jgi:hypothetical protein
VGAIPERAILLRGLGDQSAVCYDSPRRGNSGFMAAIAGSPSRSGNGRRDLRRLLLRRSARAAPRGDEGDDKLVPHVIGYRSGRLAGWARVAGADARGGLAREKRSGPPGRFQPKCICPFFSNFISCFVSPLFF